MKIRDFTSTLNFAITDLNSSRENFKIFEDDFNHIINETVEYIDNLIHDLCGEDAENLTEEEIKLIVLDDYNDIINESYKSDNVYKYTMKYIAAQYLKSHRNEIPDLLKELEKRNDINVDEGVVYRDDFHENLLLALASVVKSHKDFCNTIQKSNDKYVCEIDDMVEKYGKELGFLKFCDKYVGSNRVPYAHKRILVEYAYYLIFGIEGIDETENPKSLISKYKRKYALKEYIDQYIEDLEPEFRDETKESIISIVYELDHLGEIANGIDIHNLRMNRIRLPGLGYFSESNPDENLPKIQNLLNVDYLDKVDLDVLMRMNSFYNNRFAKIIERYSEALFIIINTSSIKDLIEERATLTKEGLTEEVLSALLVKYQTLVFPIKNFYNTSQRKIDEKPKEYKKNTVKLENNLKNSTIQQVVLDLSSFITEVKRQWRNEYTKYFDDRLPGINNNLKTDLQLINTLYNPVFLSYMYKSEALKAEYAYMQYVANQNPNKSFNFGVVIEKKEDTNPNEKTVLLASDGGVNLPNRLHTFRREFRDFVTAYTGSPLVRIYEGSFDFYVGGEYISTQLLLPTAKQHEKYIKALRKEQEDYTRYKKYLDDLSNNRVGKKTKEPKKVTHCAITPINEDFVNHIKYSADRSSFMPKYQVPCTVFDKKGNPTIIKKQPIRYLDLSNGEIYTLRQDGKLVTKRGKVYSQNEENIRGK